MITETTTIAEESNSCIDYALGKIAFELCNHPHYMTSEGDTKPYGTRIDEYGYLGIHHPANITLDLTPADEYVGALQLSCNKEDENVIKLAKIRQISIKVMDPGDELNKSPMEGQQYAFRLLCSEDGERWKILFDTTETECPYRRGWMHFKLRATEKDATPNSGVVTMRYFRIHALHNPVSSGFHVVRLRLFNFEREDMPAGEEIILPTSGYHEYEDNDTTPLATKLLNIAERLYRGTRDRFKTASEDEEKSFRDVYDHIIEKAFELQAVDGKIDQVRKIITPLISKKMEQKQIQGIASVRKQWALSLGLLITYTLVSIFCALKVR
ncbi:MAG: hypothetical protein IJ348_03530 [Alistipes sp.]|nr:hypothetical protein [Alistipes sp.]